MSTCSASIDAYLRVAAMSIALYDGLWTLPAEISLYREQKSFRQMTRACILFILIRYASIIVIVISNVGFFSSGFTASACQQFYLVSPSFKAIQTMVSQLILAARTVAVSRQNRYVMWTMWIMFSVTVALEFVSNIWRRVPFRMPPDSLHANCTSGNPPGHKVAWVHYLAAMLYDATCLSIATGFIYVQNRGQKGHTIDTLSKMLLKEGVVYFTFLTAANIFNLFLYVTATEQAQSAGATLGYATTWIMSQGLIIHLRRNNATAEFSCFRYIILISCFQNTRIL
ncbi:hypothetical protein K439DRAFT_1634755 [Ramaria rubella]|nr:hypothetical protein K439DRAFT_1634755 [Ramaria rubella]